MPCTRPYELTTKLHFLSDGSSVDTTQTSIDERSHKIQYTATVRGKYELIVTVNGMAIQGSPFVVCTLPEKLSEPIQVIGGLKRPRGIVLNSESDLLISEYGGHVTSVHSRRGNKKYQLGSKGKGDGEFKYPCGIDVDKFGNLFVADEDNHRIQKFSQNGNFVLSIGGTKKGAGHKQFCRPEGLKVIDNKLYICDTGNHRVQILDADINYIGQIGGQKGSGPGQFDRPWDIASDGNSLLYITDHGNARIQVFDKEGKYMREFGQKGRSYGKLYGPIYIHIHCNLVYVSEFHNNRVSVFTTDGKFVCTVGRKGSGPGELLYPRGIFVDKDGFVCICDSENNCVQIY